MSRVGECIHFHSGIAEDIVFLRCDVMSRHK